MRPVTPANESPTLNFCGRILSTLMAGLILLAMAALVCFIAARSHSGLAAGTQFTEAGVRRFVGRLPFAGAYLAFCGVVLALLKRRLAGFLAEIPQEWKEIRERLRKSFPRGAETKQEAGIVLLIFAIGIILRVWHLGRVIHYDEAATYLEFASRPLYRALSNYSYPNNHLLHTLLAHFCVVLFGNNAVALRLPAFAAGCLAVPMSWLAARTLYDRATGVLTAGCVAALPTFIEFSVNARGYSLQWLFVLAAMALGAVLLENPSLKTGWAAFVAVAVAGLYTIPTMAIPLAGIAIWMLTAMLVNEGIPGVSGLLKKLACVSLAVALSATLFYLPPLLASGPTAVAANRFVVSRGTPFFDGLPPLLHDTWMRWSEGVPSVILWPLIVAVIFGLSFHNKVSQPAVPMTLVLWVWSFLFAWGANIVAYPRTWSYLLLAATMTACAGLSVLVAPLARRIRMDQVALAGVASVLLVAVAGTTILRQRILFRNNETLAMADLGQIVDFLRTEFRPGDSLMAMLPADVLLKYELVRRDPKLYGSLADQRSASRVIGVLPKQGVISESIPTNQRMARLAAEDAVAPAYAASEIDLDAYAPPLLLAKFQSVTVYSFERKRNCR
jgi:dolichyl-phosphate-mannose-protein mannosyltransferase